MRDPCRIVSPDGSLMTLRVPSKPPTNLPLPTALPRRRAQVHDVELRLRQVPLVLFGEAHADRPRRHACHPAQRLVDFMDTGSMRGGLDHQIRHHGDQLAIRWVRYRNRDRRDHVVYWGHAAAVLLRAAMNPSVTTSRAAPAMIHTSPGIGLTGSC